MKFALAALLAGLVLPCAAQVVSAPAAASAPRTVRLPVDAQPAPRTAGEPEVRHTVIEGETTTIDELKVRGFTQRIVVTTKTANGARGSSYEIITGDGSRDLGDGANTSRGAAGKRVWRILDF